MTLSADFRFITFLFIGLLLAARLPAQELPETDLSQIRCMTPLIDQLDEHRDQLPPDLLMEMNALTQGVCHRPQTDHSHTSPSGRFILYYDLEGPDAVPSEDSNQSGVPDYIERAAFAADSSWNHLIAENGFVDPIPPVRPHEIYFRDFGFYGVNCPDEVGTTYTVVNNDFEGFPPNEHPKGDQIGALYVTIAHEFKHASQYATNRRRCPSGFGNVELGCSAWIEMDAVMAEELVFDDVNDYYHYIKTDLDSSIPSFQSIFGDPDIPIPVAYNHVTWKLYFAETLGAGFWADVWERSIDSWEIPALDAIKNTLLEYGTTFEREQIHNLLWHLASGPDHSPQNYGFRDRFNYPTPNFNAEFTVSDLKNIETPTVLRPLGGQFFIARPGAGAFGQPRFTLNHPDEGIAMGLLGYFRDGRVETLYASGRQAETTIQTDWNWENLHQVGMVAVNLDQQESNNFTVLIESVIADRIALEPNYPNPFRDQTQIRFSLDRQTQVELTLHDLLGRQIRTLKNGSMPQGFHTVELDARELSSGVYFYRLRTENRVESGKMMIIR